MEAVGQLTGGIAHDFNNMLAVVVGGIDLAQRRPEWAAPRGALHLQNAMEGATRAAALTRRLLSFARSEPLLPEGVDSNELIAGMSDLLDRTLGERVRCSGRSRPRRVADLRRPAPARKCDRQPGGQCARCHGRAGAASGQHRHVKLAANQIGDVRPGDYSASALPTPAAACRRMSSNGRSNRFSPPSRSVRAQGSGSARSSASLTSPAARSVSKAWSARARPFPSICPAARPPRQARECHAIPTRIEPDSQCRRRPDPRRRGRSRGSVRRLSMRSRTSTIEPVACSSGAEAIALFDAAEFDLVISDVIMPEMTGPK